MPRHLWQLPLAEGNRLKTGLSVCLCDGGGTGRGSGSPASGLMWGLGDRRGRLWPVLLIHFAQRVSALSRAQQQGSTKDHVPSPELWKGATRWPFPDLGARLDGGTGIFLSLGRRRQETTGRDSDRPPWRSGSSRQWGREPRALQYFRAGGHSLQHPGLDRLVLGGSGILHRPRPDK